MAVVVAAVADLRAQAWAIVNSVSSVDFTIVFLFFSFIAMNKQTTIAITHYRAVAVPTAVCRSLPQPSEQGPLLATT